jgi:RNA exonuclease 1
MFPTLRLFHNLACPDKNSCTRPTCLFSHRPDLPPPLSLIVPFEESKPSPSPSNNDGATVPAKRPVANSPLSNGSPIGEPPRKLQKLGSTQKQVAASSTSYTSVGAMYFTPFWWLSVLRVQTGAPVLRINAAQSKVAVPVRQVG